MIPLCDLKQQYLSLKTEIDAAMQAVAERAPYIFSPNVQALEQEVAAFCGCRYGVGVGNGTDALHLALWALDIGPGDEVIRHARSGMSPRALLARTKQPKPAVTAGDILPIGHASQRHLERRRRAA